MVPQTQFYAHCSTCMFMQLSPWMNFDNMLTLKSYYKGRMKLTMLLHTFWVKEQNFLLHEVWKYIHKVLETKLGKHASQAGETWKQQQLTYKTRRRRFVLCRKSLIHWLQHDSLFVLHSLKSLVFTKNKMIIVTLLHSFLTAVITIDPNHENLLQMKAQCLKMLTTVFSARNVLQGLTTDSTPVFLTSCCTGKFQRWSFLLCLMVHTAQKNYVAKSIGESCIDRHNTLYYPNQILKCDIWPVSKLTFQWTEKSPSFYFTFLTKALTHFSDLASITQHMRTLTAWPKCW
jgi:hypothetical protein